MTAPSSPTDPPPLSRQQRRAQQRRQLQEMTQTRVPRRLRRKLARAGLIYPQLLKPEYQVEVTHV